MEAIYRTPLRVYLVLAMLSLAGILCARKLPVSLFPNSSKPHVQACMNIELSPEAFLRQYGSTWEERIRAIKVGSLEVEKLDATYRPRDVCFNIDFKWGGDPQAAIREVQTVLQSLAAPLPEATRNTLNIWGQEENSGFLGLSFYSEQRSLTEIYDLIEPVLTPKFARIANLGDIEIYNPQRREVLVELKPEMLASFNLFPNDIGRAILQSFDAYTGGSLTVGEDQIRIQYPRGVVSFEELEGISVTTRGGRTVTLGDLAQLDLAVPSDSGRVFKTSGASSVILWGTPKPGGNVKEMAETTRQIVDQSMKDLPKDIEYRVLVDPSEFIRSSVSNVAKEVAVAAGLAVFILFLFIGNIRNVATAAIEIPLSIVLAFILMRLSGMNLNLISLGGLALSAGMNVDASVVVMENIFRHFDLAREKNGDRELTFEERLAIISSAVREVRFAVIASTIASLVVFLPLAFTSDLSYAILGDLAKAVVFSHGFSAVVALILVPTIRLHLMSGRATHETPSLLENKFRKLEFNYGTYLGRFLESPKLKLATYGSLAILFAGLMAFVVPNLPREIIGKPDTDWLMLGINVRGNTLVKQMESQTEQTEEMLFQKFGPEIQYTFTQINRANGSFIMFRLKDRSKANQLLKDLEDAFPNTPDVSYWYEAWNPAELPIPDPPDFKVTVHGNDPDAMADTTRDLQTELRERKIFERVNVEPDASLSDTLLIRPRFERWPLLAAEGIHVDVTDLSDLTRAATEGKNIGTINLRNESGKNESLNVRIRYPQEYVKNAEELGALPVGLGQRIVPLKALASVTLEKVRPGILRQNGRELYIVHARGKKDERKLTAESVKKAEQLVRDWPKVVAELKVKRQGLGGAPLAAAASVSSDSSVGTPEPTTLVVEDAQVELSDAINQLALAVSLSIALIFLTMVFQFGSLMNSLLVLVAIPLGFIGVVISLFIFKSTLSLNSMLGVILLNGLAVANSIILVDFLQRKVKEGFAPKEAAIEVARARLRPILMTSLTTGLGMLPVALGFGDGGKILQPLGIAVAGGLCFSVITTLFIVPALQVSWLEYQARATERKNLKMRSTSLASALIIAALAASNASAQPANAKVAIDATPVVSFESAYQRIQERNLSVQTQSLNVEIAKNRKLGRVGQFTPNLSLIATDTRLGLNPLPQNTVFADRRQTAALALTANLFRSGTDFAALKAANRDVDANQEALTDEKLKAEDDAAAALVALIARSRARTLISQIVVLKQESLKVARERFNRGLLASQEVDKTQIDLDNAQARLIDADVALAEAKAAVDARLGVNESLALEWPWKSVIVVGPRPDASSFALSNRPDFRSIAQTIEAERYRTYSAKSLLLPSLDLQASYGNANLDQTDRRDWSAILTLTIPIFEGFQGWSQSAVQSLVKQQAEIRRELISRTAKAEIESLTVAYRAARDSAVAREKTSKLTERLFADTQQRFRMGRTDVNALSFDQQRLLDAQILEG